MPAASGDTVTAMDWRSSPVLHTAEAGTLLDVDAHHGSPANLTFAMSEAPGAGLENHASGYHAASDIIQHGALPWQGGSTTGLMGSDLWATQPSASLLHEPKLLG